MHNPLQQIKQLQAWRGRQPRDLSIAGVMEAAVEQAAKSHKKLGELIDLWRELLPETLTSHTVLMGLRSGVLQVKVDSSSTLFEVDRLLRSGVEAELRTRFRGSLSRVKTRIGPLDEPGQTQLEVRREGDTSKPVIVRRRKTPGGKTVAPRRTRR